MSDKSSPKITIVIADDEEFARAGIRDILLQAYDFEIIGEAKDGFEVRELIPKLRPKILLLDYKCPDRARRSKKNGCVKITRIPLYWF